MVDGEFRLQLRERLVERGGVIDRSGGAVLGIAVRTAAREQPHAEPIVMAAAFADDAAAIGDRRRHTVDRAAGDGGVPMGERGIPGGGEALRTGAGAEAIGGLEAHADRAASDRDAARVGEHGDEGLLARGRPSVAAGAERDGGEEGHAAHPARWSTSRDV